MAQGPAPAASVRFGLPKGRMNEAIVALLAEAGVHLQGGERGYRPRMSLPSFEVKLLKPQNVVEMLHRGSRDAGFAGADWVEEKGAELVELLDTELNPVRIVAAAPQAILDQGLEGRRLVVATEYTSIAERWLERQSFDADIVRSYGATEVFPPEDADIILDNTATGSTLRANGLVEFDVVMTSSTRLYANPQAWEDPQRRHPLEELVLHLRSVLEARSRVMLELNVAETALEAVVEILPCMRHPTVSPLHGESGFAVKSSVPRGALTELIPELRRRGGTDLVVTRPERIVP